MFWQGRARALGAPGGCESCWRRASRMASTFFLASPNSIQSGGMEEQRVFDAGIARGHAALHDDAGLRLPDLKHRHAVDRARWIVVERAGVDDVVGADDEDDVGPGKSALIRPFRARRRRAPWLRRAARSCAQAGGQRRGDGEADGAAALAQKLRDLVKRILGLGHRHAVAGNDDDALASRMSSAVSAAVTTGPSDPCVFVALALAGAFLVGAEAAEDDVDDRAVHRLGT